jgi:hypothetical protein
VKVVVFESADPDFFIAHLDLLRGPGAVSMDAVAERAGVSKATTSKSRSV